MNECCEFVKFSTVQYSIDCVPSKGGVGQQYFFGPGWLVDENTYLRCFGEVIDRVDLLLKRVLELRYLGPNLACVGEMLLLLRLEFVLEVGDSLRVDHLLREVV